MTNKDIEIGAYYRNPNHRCIYLGVGQKKTNGKAMRLRDEVEEKNLVVISFGHDHGNICVSHKENAQFWDKIYEISYLEARKFIMGNV